MYKAIVKRLYFCCKQMPSHLDFARPWVKQTKLAEMENKKKKILTHFRRNHGYI